VSRPGHQLSYFSFLWFTFVALNQRFPKLFGPPPPWFHIHTHSAPLHFLKNINALLFPLLFYI
jgi:hypothetical protein